MDAMPGRYMESLAETFGDFVDRTRVRVCKNTLCKHYFMGVCKFRFIYIDENGKCEFFESAGKRLKPKFQGD